jgi:hypothetical protein
MSVGHGQISLSFDTVDSEAYPTGCISFEELQRSVARVALTLQTHWFVVKSGLTRAIVSSILKMYPVHPLRAENVLSKKKRKGML